MCPVSSVNHVPGSYHPNWIPGFAGMTHRIRSRGYVNAGDVGQPLIAPTMPRSHHCDVVRDRRGSHCRECGVHFEVLMNRNQAKGTAKDVAGKVQEKAGQATGSASQQVKGLAKQVT